MKMIFSPVAKTAIFIFALSVILFPNICYVLNIQNDQI